MTTTDSGYPGPEALPEWSSDHGAFVTQLRWRGQMAESCPSAQEAAVFPIDRRGCTSLRPAGRGCW